MASTVSVFPKTLFSTSSFSPSRPSLSSVLVSATSSFYLVSPSSSHKYSTRTHIINGIKSKSFYVHPLLRSNTGRKFICRAAEYKFPDPIPEFAEAETKKFRTNLLKKLSKKDYYGDSIEEVVGVCTEIFSTFLHTEYGGPGTLLVIPFIDMADTLNEQELPGGPQAARAAVKWAQAHVDKDWKEWTSNGSIQ
ncbi:unnamed protein product [Ilex paraguariensis]|uniref:Uncharacterized protein n=1 Tax=Ilex paraguariensis TaxID=185542 RepID=A0ABC8UN62_9AQUA